MIRKKWNPAAAMVVQALLAVVLRKERKRLTVVLLALS